jgi:hypothetical protein
MSVTWGVDSYRAGEITLARRWSLTLEKKTKGGLKSEQGTYRHG